MTQKPASLFDWNIVGPAIGDAFKKLNPRLMVKNPVMFVTMVGAALTTVGIFTAESGLRGFVTQLAVWLWFTVLFANFYPFSVTLDLLGEDCDTAVGVLNAYYRRAQEVVHRYGGMAQLGLGDIGHSAASLEVSDRRSEMAAIIKRAVIGVPSKCRMEIKRAGSMPHSLTSSERIWASRFCSTRKTWS